MRNRKYKPVNKQEFKKIKKLTDKFNGAETKRILKTIGNPRSSAVVYMIEKSKNFADYKRRTKARYENGDKERENVKMAKLSNDLTVDEALDRAISFMRATTKMLESVKNKLDGEE